MCASAAQLGVVDAGRAGVAGSAWGAAHAAWRTPTGWPSTVRLDGVRDLDQVRASRQVRQLVTDQLREGKGWLPADALAERFDVAALLGTMRRGLHGVGNVALAHFQAVDTLVRGPGRLWIAANAVSQPAYRGYATIAAAVPPALAIGPGAEVRVPMSVTVIGGVIVSTFFTLFVVPCVYRLTVRDWSKKA